MPDGGHHPELEPDANALVIASIAGLLAPDVRAARNWADLEQRLDEKGYQARDGYLVTAPHGKCICKLAEIGVVGA